jgi:acetyltransferase EpsM
VTGRPLAIVGGGEHAVVVLEAARSRAGVWDVVGFCDRSRSSWLASRDMGLADLGDDDALAARVAADPDHAPALLLGIGGGTHPGIRETIVRRFGPAATWATVIHASAVVAPSARLGPGTVVAAGAVVQSGVIGGSNVLINTGAIVEHDVVLGDFSHVGPGAAVGGGTRIGARVFIGLGARVRDHIAIGDDVTIGMGAAVVGDVGAGRTVLGVPARDADDTRDARP